MFFVVFLKGGKKGKATFKIISLDYLHEVLTFFLDGCAKFEKVVHVGSEYIYIYTLEVKDHKKNSPLELLIINPY